MKDMETVTRRMMCLCGRALSVATRGHSIEKEVYCPCCGRSLNRVVTTDEFVRIYYKVS